ncbi:bifunctional deaminase-reductase domain protein [Staphylotrichum tortipilum]|uniref:2,5-diamino-6-ribosylamino-4(3H)-pyrimidinone 5'-phosphate reductase n=1 Tax=Staphylotrichum tortipilum TaxID=2831512 RepID=A0AAN6MA77_9PEZI|nr:bifunctional deaminase-reductase domain protein [Staphylotrichum longicolle]
MPSSRLLRYNFAPTLNGTIASLPSHTTPWIVSDPSISFPALYASFSTFIMGRKTYEALLAMAAAGEKNPLAGRPRESVVVFTRDTDKAREWDGEGKGDVTVVKEGIVGFVRGLKEKEEGGGDIWLMGGGEVAGVLMRAGLVDVVEAAIMPVVVLGEGVRMFGDAGDGGDLKLVLEKVEGLESGIVMTRYRVVYD